MKLPRRKFLHLAAGAATLPVVSRIASAQTYPARPVRIVVGFPAGGGERHHRSLNGSKTIRAARPAIRHREFRRVPQPISPRRQSCVREANGGGGEANLGEQRQAIPCRDVERLKHVGHGSGPLLPAI